MTKSISPILMIHYTFNNFGSNIKFYGIIKHNVQVTKFDLISPVKTDELLIIAIELWLHYAI